MKIIVLVFISIFLGAAHSAEVKSSLLASDTKGAIHFASTNPHVTWNQVISGQIELSSEISGEIFFPSTVLGGIQASADRKLPIMVIVHGSSGVKKSVYEWAKFMNSLGIAAFVIDTFTGRGITRTAEDQSQMTHPASGVDALLALKLLATHPFIDSQKIAIMGFSRGGRAAQFSSFDTARKGVLGKDSQLMYAAHLAFYGGCSEVAKTTGKPIIMYDGAADDYVPATDCTYVKDILNAQGANIEQIIYPGAYHGFDTENKVMWLPEVQRLSKCIVIRDFDTGLRYARASPNPMVPMTTEESKPYSCPAGLGAHAGEDISARSKNREDVKQFVTRYLKN